MRELEKNRREVLWCAAFGSLLLVTGCVKMKERSESDVRDTLTVSTDVTPSVGAISDSLYLENTVVKSEEENESADDAYELGYKEGYDQGVDDIRSGRRQGDGYDDSNDYDGIKERKYRQGYEEGYDRGYRKE